MGSTTALNQSGHIIIGWTAESDDEAARVIQVKMDQGFHFFQRAPFGDREVKIEQLSEIMGREVMVHDADFAKLITDGKATILSRFAYAAGAAVAGYRKRFSDAREAARADTYSVRQLGGG